MNSERIPLPQFASYPTVPQQHTAAPHYLARQVPMKSLPNTMYTIMDMIHMERADAAKAVIEGQTSRMVSHMLIETPKFMHIHDSNPTLHASNEPSKRGEKRRVTTKEKKEEE